MAFYGIVLCLFLQAVSYSLAIKCRYAEVGSTYNQTAFSRKFPFTWEGGYWEEGNGESTFVMATCSSVSHCEPSPPFRDLITATATLTPENTILSVLTFKSVPIRIYLPTHSFLAKKLITKCDGQYMCTFWEIYEKPQKPVCKLTKRPSEVEITCSTNRMYPSGGCIMMMDFEGNRTFVPSTAVAGPSFEDYFYCKCSSKISVSSLQAGKYNFSALIHPYFIYSSGTEQGTRSKNVTVIIGNHTSQ